MVPVAGEGIEVGLGGQRVAHVLGEHVRRVHPEAVDATVGPEPQDVQELLADLLVGPVQVWLLRGEGMQVPLAIGNPGPGAAAEQRAPVGRRLGTIRPRAVAEVVPLAGGGSRRRSECLLEPAMLVGGVIGNDVDQDADAVVVQRGDQGLEVGQGADPRVDVPVVDDVVAAVGQIRRVERAEPHGVDPQGCQVVDARQDAAHVTDTVGIAVGEATRVNLVDDSLAPPFGALSGDDRLLVHGDRHGAVPSERTRTEGIGGQTRRDHLCVCAQVIAVTCPIVSMVERISSTGAKWYFPTRLT